MKILATLLTLAALAGTTASAQSAQSPPMATASVSPGIGGPHRVGGTHDAAARTAHDDAFIGARRAMLDNDLERFNRAVQPIPRDHPLQAYVDYWRLRILLGPRRAEGLNGEADPAVRAFLAAHPGTIVADLMRRDWLLALGRRGAWAAFDAEYPRWILRDESAPACYAQMSALSRLAPGRRLPAARAREARRLVMQPTALNRACSELLGELAGAGQLTATERRQRLLLALESNSPADIRQAARLFDDALDEKRLGQALTRPALALQSAPPKTLRLVALVRLARTDPAEAAERMADAAAVLSADERRFVWAQIASVGMRRLLPQSHAWARKAAGAKVSDETRVWLVRAALRPQDWQLVRRTILAMTPQTRREPTWTYWLGRAHHALGESDRATKLFTSLAMRHDYYGKLANEELGRRTGLPSRPPTASDTAVARFDSNPGFKRALAFYGLGMRFEGNREWNFQLRGLSEDRIRSAATWAMRRGLLDRAINSDERIGGPGDFAMRFPTPFADQLLPIAREQNLDPAWVYGLIRQESRFIMEARSHVGASGLMQLMPGTARWVAGKLGRKDFTLADINELQTNLEFGSFYLKAALDDLDGSKVLASAGYNAGPGRARAWRGTLSTPLEGAIFTEIIPFKETRGYVKNVLSNATDYAALFSGEPQSLKARLGIIEPKPAGTTPLP